MMMTNEIKEAILNVTGENRADCINKVTELLKAEVNDHMVEVKTSKSVLWGDLVIDLTTRKKKGVQVITNFFTWEEGNKSNTIKMWR